MPAIPGGRRKPLLRFLHVRHPWRPKKTANEWRFRKNAALGEPHSFVALNYFA
jgi:hypothetical protein